MTHDFTERQEDIVRRFAHRLVEIEKLHRAQMTCEECGKPWPCPTKLRLDESLPEES